MTTASSTSRHPRRALGALAAVACCFAFAGCATQVKGRGTPVRVFSPSTATSDSVAPLPTATTSVWEQTKDSVTGISFALPGKAKLSITPAGGGQRRLYDVQVAANLGLSVAIAPSGVGRKYTSKNLAALVPALLTQLKSSGVKDAKILERSAHNSNGRATLDFRLRFTAAKPSTGTRTWFIHGATDGNFLVVLQSIAVAAHADANLESTARAYQEKLVASLRLP